MKKRLSALFTALLVLLTCLFAAAPVYATGTDKYVNAGYTNGNSDGTSNAPYTTLEAAYNDVNANGTIYLLSDVTLTTGLAIGKNIKITSNTGSTYSIKRGASMTASLLTVNSTYTLTLSNITIDGSSVSANTPLINASNGNLVLTEGTTVKNGVSTVSNTGGGILAGTNNVTVGGKVVVYGNTANGVPSDLYLPAGSTITLNSLLADSKIGVYTATAPTSGSAVQITTGTAAETDRAYFVSDRTGASVTLNTNLYLTAVSDPTITAALGTSDNTHYYITVATTVDDWWYGVRDANNALLSPTSVVDQTAATVSTLTGNTGWYKNSAATGGKLVFGPFAAGTKYTVVARQNGGSEKSLTVLTTSPVDPTVAAASRPAAGMPSLTVGDHSITVNPASPSYEYQLVDGSTAVTAPTAVSSAGATLVPTSAGWVTVTAAGKFAFTGLTASHSYKVLMRVKTDAANNPLSSEILPQNYPTSSTTAVTTLASPTVTFAQQGTTGNYYITIPSSSAALDYAVVNASGAIVPSGTSWVTGNSSTLTFGPYTTAGSLTVLSKPTGFTPGTSPIAPATDKVVATLGSYGISGVRAEADPANAGKGRIVVAAPDKTLWYNIVLTSAGTIAGTWTQHTDGSDIVFSNLNLNTTYTVITNTSNATPSPLPAGTQVTTPPASIAASSVTRWPDYIELKPVDVNTEYALLDETGAQLTAVKATTSSGAALSGINGWFRTNTGALWFINLDPALTYKVVSRTAATATAPASASSAPITVYALRTEAPTAIAQNSATFQATFSGASWTSANGGFFINSASTYQSPAFAQAFSLGMGGMVAGTSYTYQAWATVDGINYRGALRSMTSLPSSLPSGTITVTLNNLSASVPARLTLCSGDSVLQTNDLTLAAGVSTSVFRYVANGTYNVMLEADGKTATRMVVVANGIGAVTFTRPADLLAETIVTVADGLPAIAVGNLPSLITAADQTAAQTNGQHIVYRFTASAGVSTSVEAAALTTFAKNNWGSYDLYLLNFDLTKTTFTGKLGDGGVPQTTAYALEEIAVPIPATLQKDTWKTDREIAVLRYHQNAAAAMNELSARQTTPTVEGYFVDYDNAVVYVYAGRYSLYAIARVSDPLATGTLTRTLTGTVGSSTVTATGAIATATKMVLTENGVHAESSNCAACNEIRQMIADKKTISVFNMALQNDSVTPYSGRLTITATVPSDYEGKTVQIVHCNNGTLETINATVENGKVTFTTNSVGSFAIVRSATASNPDTGDAALLKILVPVGAALLVLAGLTAILAVRRKRKKG